jgi:hypothetical protein
MARKFSRVSFSRPFLSPEPLFPFGEQATSEIDQSHARILSVARLEKASGTSYMRPFPSAHFRMSDWVGSVSRQKGLPRDGGVSSEKGYRVTESK